MKTQENIMNTQLLVGTTVVAEKAGQPDQLWLVMERGTKAVTLKKMDGNGKTFGLPTATEILSDVDDVVGDGTEQLVEWVSGAALNADLAYVK